MDVGPPSWKISVAIRRCEAMKDPPGLKKPLLALPQSRRDFLSLGISLALHAPHSVRTTNCPRRASSVGSVSVLGTTISRVSPGRRWKKLSPVSVREQRRVVRPPQPDVGREAAGVQGRRGSRRASSVSVTFRPGSDARQSFGSARNRKFSAGLPARRRTRTGHEGTRPAPAPAPPPGRTTPRPPRRCAPTCARRASASASVSPSNVCSVSVSVPARA